jgi:hypothetical protein
MKTKSTSILGLLLGAAITLASIQPASATVVTTTQLNNRTYYVDVLPSGSSADVWFRTSQYACSPSDIYVAKITRGTVKVAAKQSISQAASAFCSLKKVYDNGKTAVGCAATAGTAVCLASSVPTGLTTAVFCSVAVKYTITKGAKDCLLGVSNTVAGWLAGERNWSAFATGYNVRTASWGNAIDSAIDWGCTWAK